MDADREQWSGERRDLEARHQASEQRWAMEVDRSREATKRLEADLGKDRAAFAKHQIQWQEDRERLEAQVQSALIRDTEHVAKLGKLRSDLESMQETHNRAIESHRQRERDLIQRAVLAETQLAGAVEQLTEKGSELAHLVRSLVEQDRQRKAPGAPGAPKR